LPALALIGAATLVAAPSPGIAAGPFSEFSGRWSGNGTIRPQGGSPERIRCTATYKPRGANDLDVRLRCASDSYNFDLSGQFTADSNNSISGRWNENGRGVGGTATGMARGDRMTIQVESSGFSANMQMMMRGRRQDVTIDSHGGGQIVKASITMNRS
jgi:hypothetical protein